MVLSRWAEISALMVLLCFSQTALSASAGTLAGFELEKDVSQHARIDLDQQVLDQGGIMSGRVYGMGNHSMKSDGSMRTIRGFSTSSGQKLKNEGYYELYRSFYGSSSYADQFVMAALGGTGELRDLSKIFRTEAARMGTKVLSIWMYVIHELESAVNDCYEGGSLGVSQGVKHWEEGWAFYAGSLEGPDGSGSGTLLYALAEEYCALFGTCSKNGRAAVNDALLLLYKEGRQQIQAENCAEVIDTKIKIIRKMIVPLVQGFLLNTIRAKPEGPKQEIAHASGLVFSRGILPLISHCNQQSVYILERNFMPEAEPPMIDTVWFVADILYGELSCMGINCEDIGSMEGLPMCWVSKEFDLIPGSDRLSIAKINPKQQNIAEDFMEPQPSAEALL